MSLRGIQRLSAFYVQNNKYILTKTIFTNQLNISSPKRLFFSRKTDNEEVPEGKIRVYRGLLSSQIRMVKWFSMTTSFMGIIAQPFIYRQLCELDNLPMLIGCCTFVGFFTFTTPFLLHFITKKYITDLDYDPAKQTYTASTVNFFCLPKKMEFTPEDVKVPDVPGMFTTFLAKGKPLFMEARLFEDPTHYIKIMGYDKPIDLKLYKSEEGKDN